MRRFDGDAVAEAVKDAEAALEKVICSRPAAVQGNQVNLNGYYEKR